MTRVLALLAAIALIIGAIFVRRALDDDGAGSTDGGPTTTHVVCAEELRAACEDLGFGPRFTIQIEDALTTATALEQGSATGVLDIWAVPQPWPGIVDDARTRAGLAPLFADEPVALASSPIVAVGAANLSTCDWKCLGEKGLKLGSRPLATSGLGVLTVGAAAAGYFGRADFARNDFDPAFDRWLSGFATHIEATTDPVTKLLQSRAFFDVALSFEAEAAPIMDAATVDRTDGLALLHPAPAATLDAVIVTVPSASTTEARDLASSLRNALTAAGWDDTSTASNGLPSPGVLIALRDRVSR